MAAAATGSPSSPAAIFYARLRIVFENRAKMKYGDTGGKKRGRDISEEREVMEKKGGKDKSDGRDERKK